MSILKTNAIRDTADGNTTTINGILLNAGSLEPDDRIINGDFGVWQRGTNFTAVEYGADRWVNNLIGGTVTMSRQEFALGTMLGSNSPKYFMRQTVSNQTLPGHVALTNHRIESVRSYAGQTITVLGWVRRSSGNGNMIVEGEQYFGGGGGGSPSRDGISSTTVTLTTAWAPFAVVLSIPTVTGKTLGIFGNDTLSINFWTSAGADWNARSNSLGLQTIGLDLWGIHIKRGSHTVSAIDLYRPRDLSTELALCHRYYWKGLSGVSFNFSAHAAFTYASWYIAFPVTMRAIPTASAVYPATNGADSLGFTPLQSGGRLIARSTVTSSNCNFTMGVNDYVAADAEL